MINYVVTEYSRLYVCTTKLAIVMGLLLWPERILYFILKTEDELLVRYKLEEFMRR